MKKILLSLTSSLLPALLLAQTWTVVTPGPQGTGKDLSVHNGKLFLSTQSGGPYVTSNGTTWNQVANGLATYGLFGQGISSAGTFLYYGSKDGLYRSNDDGATWNLVNTGLQPTGAPTSKAVAATYLFSSTYFCIYHATVSSGGGIYRSTDGQTWTASSAGLPSNVTIYQLNQIGGNLYACSNLDLYESTDNGMTWSSVATNGSKVYNGLFDHAGGRRLIHTTFGMEKSDDNGTSWDTITSGIKSSTICGFIQGSNDTVYAYTANDGVFYSVDTGATWVDITGDLTSNDVLFMGDVERFNGSLYIATLSAVKSNGSGSSTSMAEFQKTYFNIYPNPFNEFLNIENKEHLNLKIQIMDVTGRTVSTERSNKSVVRLKTDLLTDGIYFVRLQNALSGHLIDSFKLIKQ